MVTHSSGSTSKMKKAYHLDEGNLRQEDNEPLESNQEKPFFQRHNNITLAAAMCSLVLTGALTVGDSIRSTLVNWLNKE